MSDQKIEELFGIDLRSLAFFRICISLLLIVDILQRMSDLEAFYTDKGIFTTELLNTHFYKGNPYLSFHMLNGSIDFQGAVA